LRSNSKASRAPSSDGIGLEKTLTEALAFPQTYSMVGVINGAVRLSAPWDTMV